MTINSKKNYEHICSATSRQKSSNARTAVLCFYYSYTWAAATRYKAVAACKFGGRFEGWTIVADINDNKKFILL